MFWILGQILSIFKVFMHSDRSFLKVIKLSFGDLWFDELSWWQTKQGHVILCYYDIIIIIYIFK